MNNIFAFTSDLLKIGFVFIGCILNTRAIFGISRLGAAHLGDTLCGSTLPRLLNLVSDAMIFIDDCPITRAVFTGNPYVTGFKCGATVNLQYRMRGNGHLIQRLEQGFDLPVSQIPRPEIYLSGNEKDWAVRFLEELRPSKPVCVLSTGAYTDGANVKRVDWESAVKVLKTQYTVVQAILNESPVAGAVHVYKLSIRQYISLISVTDCFMGGTSGGSHIAAAFDVPAIIVAWRDIIAKARFPISGLGIPAAFLYPQQWLLAWEDLWKGEFKQTALESVLSEIDALGGKCKPCYTTDGGHANGILPEQPKMIECLKERRLIVSRNWS